MQILNNFEDSCYRNEQWRSGHCSWRLECNENGKLFRGFFKMAYLCPEIIQLYVNISFQNLLSSQPPFSMPATLVWQDCTWMALLWQETLALVRNMLLLLTLIIVIIQVRKLSGFDRLMKDISQWKIYHIILWYIWLDNLTYMIAV